MYNYFTFCDFNVTELVLIRFVWVILFIPENLSL